MIVPATKRSSSYPTYEEWKLGDTLNKKFGKFGSYPTYEEWKQNDDYFYVSFKDLFLSYL